MSYSISENIIKTLKCTFCKKYLSVPPIYYSTDGKYKCGRCSFIKFESSEGNRATLFESLASMMKFPCSFEECHLKLPWNDITKHERDCSKREIACPESNCNMKIRLEKFLRHCKDVHMYHKSCFKSRECLNEKGLCRSFIVSDSDQIYLLYDYVNDTVCAFSLYCFSVENSSNVFNLKIKTNVSFINFSEQKITLYNDKEDCAQCLLKKCSNKFHKYSKLYEDHNLTDLMTTIINKTSLKDILGSDDIQYVITIKEKPQVDKIKKDNYMANNNDVLRQVLECQICNYFMAPPIFICETGHSLCKECKSRLTKCPLCEAVFIDKATRNFSLEELAERVDLPCTNNHIGCDFVGSIEDIQVHEMDCDV